RSTWAACGAERACAVADGGAPAGAVRPNATGAAPPGAEAVTSNVPALVPAGGVTAASPALSVVTVVADSCAVALPVAGAGAVKVTVVDGTRLPNASLTTTTSGWVNAVATVACWPAPLCTAIVVAESDRFASAKVAGVVT